jgi:hypothetical protein
LACSVNARGYHFILLALALAFLAAALVVRKPWSGGPEPPRLAPLAVIPPGAAFVLDVDVARLKTSAAGTELSRLGWARFAPAGSNEEFQPLRDVDEIVLVVPGSARLAHERNVSFEPDAVAVVASGRFTGKAVADAAVERIRARGGEPSRTTLGTFESVRDLRGTGEVAARDGLLILSDGSYLRAVLAAAEGKRSDGSESERTRDRVHSELRRTFGRGAPVTATLTLPDGWLEAAFGDPDVRRSPLSLVRSAAARVNVQRTVDLDVLLICSNADDCSRVAAFLRDMRDDLERNLGAATVFRRFAETVPSHRERIDMSLSVPISDVARLFAPPASSAPGRRQ